MTRIAGVSRNDAKRTETAAKRKIRRRTDSPAHCRRQVVRDNGPRASSAWLDSPTA
jgi:hypothetical protein